MRLSHVSYIGFATQNSESLVTEPRIFLEKNE
jgi:hypothetical protein